LGRFEDVHPKKLTRRGNAKNKSTAQLIVFAKRNLITIKLQPVSKGAEEEVEFEVQNI